MRRLVRVVATVFIASLPVISGSAAHGQDGGTCVGAFVPTESTSTAASTSAGTTDPPAPNAAVCHGTLTSGSSTGSSGTSGAALVSAGRTGGTGKKYEPYDRVVTQPDGQGCIATGYKEVGTGRPADGFVPVAEQQFPTTPNAFGRYYNNVYQDYPPCPEQPRAPGEPEPVVTRAMVAARYWEQVPLPVPKPVIAPGRAITGKNAFLETNGEITDTYTNDTIFGPLEIVSTGRYYVDWGDGKGGTGPYSLEGQPWPDGQVTHEYVDVGSYNVKVTEKWTGQWRLGGESGSLRTLETVGLIANFPVQQIQAVIGR